LEALDLANLVIDSLKFAAEGQSVTGSIALSRMPRLADVLSNHAGSLDCALSGFEERRFGTGKLGLHLRISGRLTLHCQRCLAEVVHECAVDSHLLLIPPGEEWPEEEVEADDYDALPADRELSVLALVEEEVLLALPIVPRHADCQLPVDAGSGVGNESRSPFAALAGLKKH
jgi:uncharacterized protein